MKNIAIITARSGSKGLPHKNIRDLAGKPLMAWTIEAAVKSGMFDTVMVSTDSEEYAHIARKYGAEVPFLRSEATSGDNSNSWDVVAEVLREYRKLGREFDTLMLLQPTSPLRDENDIREAYRVLEETGGNGVVANCECDHSPLWAISYDETFSYGTGMLQVKQAFDKEFNLMDKNRYNRRQALPTFHRANGSMYLVKVKRFEEDHYIYDENCYAYVMPQENSIDVDTELDFVIAEAVLRHFKKI